MYRRFAAVLAALLALGGCADPTTSAEYLDLEAQLAEAGGRVAELETETDELEQSVLDAEATVAELEQAIAEASADLEEERSTAEAERERLRADLDEWQAFAGTDEPRLWPTDFYQLFVANCASGPDAFPEETCSCLAEFLQSEASLFDLVYSNEAFVAAELGTVDLDPITLFPVSFPDELALTWSEAFLICS